MNLSRISESKETRIIVGRSVHEILRICEELEADPFEFSPILQSLLTSDLLDI